MTTLSIEVSEQLAARLESIAEAKQVSPAEVVREVISAYLSSEPLGNGPQPRSFFEAAQDLIGCLEGPGDLNTNPAHMEGFGES